jgi:hypothetical protein
MIAIQKTNKNTSLEILHTVEEDDPSISLQEGKYITHDGTTTTRSPASSLAGGPHIMGQEVIDERDEECTVNSGFGAKGVHFRKILKVTKTFMSSSWVASVSWLFVQIHSTS